MKTKKKIQTAPTNTLTHQQVADLVMTLPPDRLVSVYDFTLFIKSHPLTPALAPDIFGESAGEISVDESEWAQQFESSRAGLRKIAAEAAAEFHAGHTKPMEFTPEGRISR
jgi:hypothetical protein